MRVASISAMRRAPVGRYVAGERFVHFCASPTLWGVLLWGRPNRSDAAGLGRSLVLELEAPAVPHVSMVNASHIEGVDAGAFEALHEYVTAQREALSKQVTRLALVRPAGMEGALVAGFFEVMPRPYPVQVFESSEDALGWLDEDPVTEAHPERPSAFGGALAELFQKASAMPPMVAQLRAVLGSQLRDVSVSEVARKLSVSERTLQRRLRDAGTSFQEELSGARLRTAQRMMLDSDAPLTEIALEIGCASLQHFSALFRKRTGESPSAWRRRNGRDG